MTDPAKARRVDSRIDLVEKYGLKFDRTDDRRDLGVRMYTLRAAEDPLKHTGYLNLAKAKIYEAVKDHIQTPTATAAEGDSSSSTSPAPPATLPFHIVGACYDPYDNDSATLAPRTPASDGKPAAAAMMNIHTFKIKIFPPDRSPEIDEAGEYVVMFYQPKDHYVVSPDGVIIRGDA